MLGIVGILIFHNDAFALSILS